MVAPKASVNQRDSRLVGTEFGTIAGFADECLETCARVVARRPPLLAQGLGAKGKRLPQIPANSYVVFFSATAAPRPSARSSRVSSLNRSS